MMIKYTEKLETNIKSELHEGTKWIHKTETNKPKKKNVLQKYFTKKYPWLRFEPSPITVLHINSFYAFTALLSSELCDTLVMQRDFYTSIIVIVAFDAGIEAGSINYLPYIVLHSSIHHCKEINL